MSDYICYFGSKDEPNKTTLGITKEDRRRHLYILGKTGMGKSTLLQNMILQDIFAGQGVCFLDPHGDSVEYILDRIPPHRHQDVIYFNPADIEHPVALNILESQGASEDFLIVNGLMSVFKRIWAGTWSSRMEYILNNTLLALLEESDATLLGVIKMLTDENYCQYIVERTKNPTVKNFWTKEYATFHDRYRNEAVAPIINKIGQFFSTHLIRNILGQSQSSFNLRKIMDQKKILLVNLSKGRLGEDNSNLLGSLLVTKIQLAAMSRVDISEQKRQDFFLYVDEFQNFTTDSFATILSEARKYGLDLTLAHQYISQLPETGNEKVRNAIFGNVGSFIVFQVGAEDAERLAKEFAPSLKSQQLIDLNKAEIAVKLSVNQKNLQPVLASTLPPIFDQLGIGHKSKLIARSRQKFGRNRQEVERKIEEYLYKEYELGEKSKMQNKPKNKAKGSKLPN